MTTNPALTCIVSLICPGPSLGDLRAMVELGRSLGASDDLALLDGWHASLVDAPDDTVGRTLGDLQAFLDRHADREPNVEIVDADTICIDLPVTSAVEIACGEHVGAAPANVLVTVHPVCADEHE